ncbi:hypothetical protein QFC20_002056 [Naganishia adeliensis]|uniref:Uncharacterized protein n=1 Tax=Naganishia adeliensis TaxID=92952 RepID=A0ACC2WPM7_9TREE|nr:hypothetical protein QFC20_002056 [Naganishia adeliensis]
MSERERRRAQNRENLRAHYGLQGKKGDVQDKAENGREVAGDPLDPDSPAFNPDKYYQHLISTASLPQLLRESTNLNSGHTISTLNAKTPQLQAIVNALQERFDEISTLVENVSLPVKQEHMDTTQPTEE